MEEIEKFTRQTIAVEKVEGFGPAPDERAEPIAMGRQTLWGGVGKPPSRDVMASAARAAAFEVSTEDGISAYVAGIAPAAPDIAALVALGSEVVQPPREDLEAAPPLAAGRRADLEALWTLFSPNIETPVQLEVLRRAEKGGKIGTHSVSLLKELYAMDANADGLLSWS